MTLRAMRRERRPTRVMLLVDLDSRGVPGPRAVRRCGYAVQFSTCRVLFQERAIVLFYTWLLLYQPVVGLLSRRLPASHFVRSLAWSISDVEHVSGCGGRARFGRAPANSLWVVLADVGFSTLVRSGDQSLPCRSLRSMANHFVQFSRRLCLLQHMSASPRRCMATASSAVQVIAEWW